MTRGMDSARPANLMKYSTTMTGWDEGAWPVLTKAQTALDAWNAAPGVVRQSMPGAQDVLTAVSGHLSKWRIKDDWVATVAAGFIAADGCPAGVPRLTPNDYLEASGTAGIVRPDPLLLPKIVPDESRYRPAVSTPAQAARLARSLKNLKDPNAILKVLRQLPQDPDDPTSAAVLAAFYNALGANKILQMAATLHGTQGLQTLDDTLAQATQSPSFHLYTQFSDLMATPGAGSPPTQTAFEYLLQYGVYSTRWLVMTYSTDWYPILDPSPVVFDAIARNPAAAALILGTYFQLPVAAGQSAPPTAAQPPLDGLLSYLQLDGQIEPSLGPAAARLLRAATTGDSLDAQRNRTLLVQAIASGRYDNLPVVDLQAIGAMAAVNLPEISQEPDALAFFENLTRGHPEIAVQLSKAATAQYSVTMPGPKGTDSATEQALTTWANKTGDASQVVFQALLDNGMLNAEQQTRQWEWEWFAGEVGVNAALTAVVPEVEVESQIATATANLGIDEGKEGLLEWLEQQVKPDFTGQALAGYDANARQIMSQQILQATYVMYLKGDIPPAPGNMNAGDYIRDIVRAFESTYDSNDADFGADLRRDGVNLPPGKLDILTGTLGNLMAHDEGLLAPPRKS